MNGYAEVSPQSWDAERPLSEDEVWLLRDAMNTVAHEATHLMAPLGDKTGTGGLPVRRCRVRVRRGAHRVLGRRQP
ncbi:hypothetical protein ACXJJ3_30115 [Kribbella sp. WER1]